MQKIEFEIFGGKILKLDTYRRITQTRRIFKLPAIHYTCSQAGDTNTDLYHVNR